MNEFSFFEIFLYKINNFFKKICMTRISEEMNDIDMITWIQRGVMRK